MKKLLLLFTLILAVSCSENKFEQIEYFKSSDRFRVFVYVAPTATIEEIKAHASSQMWTQGKVTEVLYYRDNPFGTKTFSKVSTSRSFQDAFHNAIVNGCIFRCQINWFGEKYFSETPYEDRLKTIEEEKILNEMLKNGTLK